MNLHDQIEEYRILKQQLADLKTLEMEKRAALVQALSPNMDLPVGTHKFEQDGMSVKVVMKLNYRIDKDILETLDLSEEEAECVRWKPELNLRAYKSADDTDTLDDAIVATDAAPTVEVELL